MLDAASRELFGRPYAPAAERLAKRIETLSAAERYPAGVSGFVRIELDPTARNVCSRQGCRSTTATPSGAFSPKP